MAMRQSHQMFLQTFMSRGILDAKEVKQMYKLCCEQYQGMQIMYLLLGYLVKINRDFIVFEGWFISVNTCLFGRDFVIVYWLLIILKTCLIHG